MAASFLNAADVIAVVTAPGAEGPLVERVFRDLQQGVGTHILRVDGEGPPWSSSTPFPNGKGHPWFGSDLSLLATQFAGIGEGDAEVRRSVLLWHGLDDYVTQHPARFPEVLSQLRRSLERPRDGAWRPFQLDRAVLVGGPVLQEELGTLAERLGETLRFRYLLVR